MCKDTLWVTTARAHVAAPEVPLRVLDSLAGNRKRNDLFVEAAREKLDRLKLRKAAYAAAGALKDADTPDWETPEATSAWVHDLRRESDERAFGRDETGRPR